MKRLVFLVVLFFAVSLNGYAQQGGTESCYQNYFGKLANGYNALAIAEDGGYFVCGYAFGRYKKEFAAKAALTECERNRLAPANEVQGIRKIMTHCRVYQFRHVE